MSRRTFRIGAWVALAAVIVSAALTVMAGVVGVLALTGKETYPVHYSLGPLEYSDTISTGVMTGTPICQTADVNLDVSATPDCNSHFVHDDVSRSGGPIHHQDADVRPTEVVLTGDLALTSVGGWSPFVAAQVVKKVLIGTVITWGLVLVWRLLAAAAAGTAFSARTVRHLRTLGWLAIASAALAPALEHFTDLRQLGYGGPSFNEEMMLQPWNRVDGYPGGVDFVQVALGALVLLVAEVFRHGASIETERRLTV